MRRNTLTTTVYKFDVLPEDVQEKAIENLYDINVNCCEWYDFVYEDVKTIGEILGINIFEIYFSGFSSQGDGACFEGSYSYQKNSVKAIKEYAPIDKELHSIAKELQGIQRKAFYKLYANIKHSGHYYHSMCTNIDVYHEDYYYSLPKNVNDQDLKDCLRNFMDWIYSTLQNEYDNLTSEEAIKETIECNEYEFTEDGKLY